MTQSYAGQLALITGASSGIGAAFAEDLAARGANLFLTARPEDEAELQAIAQSLVIRFGIDVRVFVADLSLPTGAQQLIDAVQPESTRVDVLINNAGFAHFGRFDAAAFAVHHAQMQCNVISVAQLTHAMLHPMRRRGYGAIVHTASLGALIPMPLFATYCATKAFILQLSETLWIENQTSGVRITAACPGPTATHLGTRAKIRFAPEVKLEKAEDVVAAAFRALDNGLSRCHTKRFAAFRVLCLSMLPRAWLLEKIGSLFSRSVEAVP